MDLHINNSFILFLLLLFLYIYKIDVLYLYYEKKVINNFALQKNSTKLSSNLLYLLNILNDINNKEINLNSSEIDLNSFTYNKCATHKIPKVSGQLETAQYLRYTNSSLIRFADGEVKLILGKGIHGKERPNQALAKRMYEAFKDNDERIAVGLPNVFTLCPPYKKKLYDAWFGRFDYITKWMLKNVNYKRQYFDAFITSPYVTTYRTSCELVDKVYENLRAIWEDKDIVWLRGDNGEEYDYDVFDNVRNKKIYYGRANNSWAKYDEYKQLLLNEDPAKLFIITLGHVSRILVYDLTKEGRRALDLGHLPKDYDHFKKGLRPVNFYAV